MPPRTTLWPLEAHTKGKHAVLKRYLDAWFPIIGRYNGRVLFIDGFAGPGKYAGGEDGSPLIALSCLREHSAAGSIKEVIFAFIEADKARMEHLTQTTKELQEGGQVPSNGKIFVEHGTFDENLTRILDYLDEQQSRIAPAFVMVDPFGVSGIPMSVIKRLIENERVELYVSLMYEFLNRFKNTPEFTDHLDNLYGTTEWRQGLEIESSEERREFFFDLYEKQLRAAGARYVVRFELFAENRLKYAIFFATKHPLGADKMKQAIWGLDPSGDYEFHGGRSNQLDLTLPSPNFGPLRAAISSFLQGIDPEQWVRVEQVKEFVIASTDYHSNQYKNNVLKVLEKEGLIEVDSTSRKAKGYPDGTRLRWKR